MHTKSFCPKRAGRAVQPGAPVVTSCLRLFRPNPMAGSGLVPIALVVIEKVINAPQENICGEQRTDLNLQLVMSVRNLQESVASASAPPIRYATRN